MKWYRRFITLLFPERCPYCGKLIKPYEIACESCYADIRRKHQLIKGGAGGCRCISSFAYDGRVRRLILRIKYRERTQFIPQIAAILTEDILSAYGENAFDLITAVPMHKKDLRRREYNQSELLAKALGRQLDLPYTDTIRKIKRTKAQHNLNYAERKTNLIGAFELIDKERVCGKRILIVDDIITSGNTLKNCCRVLNRAKPETICCATIASAKNKYPESTVI